MRSFNFLDSISYRIFDAEYGEIVPPGFDAVRIKVDARLEGDLDWKPLVALAEEYRSQGFHLFWEVEGGIAEGMQFCLSDVSQYLALEHSLNYFVELLWQQFRESSWGVNLYRGTLDFTQIFEWSDAALNNLRKWLKTLFINIRSLNVYAIQDFGTFEQVCPEVLKGSKEGGDLLRIFCHNAILEYLSVLSKVLPYGVQTSVLLEVPRHIDLLLLMQLMTLEEYTRLNRGLALQDFPKEIFMPNHEGTKCQGKAFGYLSREILSEKKGPKIGTGLSIPPTLTTRQAVGRFREVSRRMLQNKIPFRAIAEERLTTEWEGLDYLLVDHERFGPQTLRKLKGFCAAGGTVVFIGDPLPALEGWTFEKWFAKMT
jgi:hypothetical protein